MANSIKRISTHVLDVGRGKPAADVPVRLEYQDQGGSWQVVRTARTDADGRCSQLLQADRLEPGVYRLAFDTEAYFGSQNVPALYPMVEITFHVRDGESHFHIPLLLNANGYTTYRGS